MRPLELAIHLALATILLGIRLFPGKKERWIKWLPRLTFLLVALHLATEGNRWQMIPTYGVALALLLRFVQGFYSGKPFFEHSPKRGAWLRWGGLALLAGSAALSTILPVATLPKPSGSYSVGTVTYHFIDETRQEIYSDNPADKREIVVQFWYPANADGKSKPTRWIEQAERFTPAFADFLGYPRFVPSHLHLIDSNSFADLPLAGEERYPVIILSHGWTGFRAFHTNQLEMLASHGYVVAAIDHSYGSAATVFPNGRVILNNPEALPDEDSVPAELYDRASSLLLDVYASDVGFVLDKLPELNAGEGLKRFANRLDLERIGLFGHSTGGGAIVKVCSLDERCKAGLGMDAWVEPLADETIRQGLKQPFLFMRSEPWTSNNNDKRLAILIDGSMGKRYRLGIKGTTHRDFTLHTYFSPLMTPFGLSGPLNAKRTLQLIDDYLLAFFDSYLKDQPSPLLDGPSLDYPEVEFEQF
jgi:predicted dienelactone hydrolase